MSNVTPSGTMSKCLPVKCANKLSDVYTSPEVMLLQNVCPLYIYKGQNFQRNMIYQGFIEDRSFRGVYISQTIVQSAIFLGQFFDKGVICDILQSGKFNFDMNFKFSMSTDIAKGMSYLHSHGICHGQLNSSSCFIDSK